MTKYLRILLKHKVCHRAPNKLNFTDWTVDKNDSLIKRNVQIIQAGVLEKKKIKLHPQDEILIKDAMKVICL